jgi:hypothetical protein
MKTEIKTALRVFLAHDEGLLVHFYVPPPSFLLPELHHFLVPQACSLCIVWRCGLTRLGFGRPSGFHTPALELLLTFRPLILIFLWGQDGGFLI